MFLIWALFLLSQLCFDHGNDTLSANLLEFPSNHFVCFKCLESSCCFLAHPGSSLGRLKSSLGRHVQFDRDKFTGLSVSMLELLRSPLIWIGPLVLPIEHEPPAAAWLSEWLQLFRLETRLPWPTHAESLTIVELGNEVFYCA